jgi:hypothetical protein
MITPSAAARWRKAKNFQWYVDSPEVRLVIPPATALYLYWAEFSIYWNDEEDGPPKREPFWTHGWSKVQALGVADSSTNPVALAVIPELSAPMWVRLESFAGLRRHLLSDEIAEYCIDSFPLVAVVDSRPSDDASTLAALWGGLTQDLSDWTFERGITTPSFLFA